MSLERVGWLAAGQRTASALTLVLLHLFVPDPGSSRQS